MPEVIGPTRNPFTTGDEVINRVFNRMREERSTLGLKIECFCESGRDADQTKWFSQIRGFRSGEKLLKRFVVGIAANQNKAFSEIGIRSNRGTIEVAAV